MAKEEIARFCHYVFKKPSAAEASESVYMRERVNPFTPVNGSAADVFRNDLGKRKTFLL